MIELTPCVVWSTQDCSQVRPRWHGALTTARRRARAGMAPSRPLAGPPTLA
jgi:hypothetical protein